MGVRARGGADDDPLMVSEDETDDIFVISINRVVAPSYVPIRVYDTNI